MSNKKSKPTTLKVCGKTSDMCGIQVVDEKGTILKKASGYVPDFFPGEHDGDYLMFDINIATGQLENWVPPSPETLQAWMDSLPKL